MEYEEMIKVIADSDKTTLERGDAVVRDIGKMVDSIMDYRYAAEHYEGDTDTVLLDKTMAIKNSIALLESDLDIYKEVLGISKKVIKKKNNRICKILNRMKNM